MNKKLQSGQDLVEYVMILTLIAVVIIVIIALLDRGLSSGPITTQNPTWSQQLIDSNIVIVSQPEFDQTTSIHLSIPAGCALRLVLPLDTIVSTTALHYQGDLGPLPLESNLSGEQFFFARSESNLAIALPESQHLPVTEQVCPIQESPSE